jgi:F0F1-type ATP synthase membrane subunit c/vacuolar-type H+-ATPase subunit K
MRQTKQPGNVEQSYRTLILIWFALLNSQLILLLVLYFAKPEIFRFDFSKPLLGENSVMVIVLAVLAVSTFLLSFVLRKKFFNQAITEQKMELVQTAVIIGCSLCEAISLFGFVLVFILNYQYFFLWFALGILGIILHFPRRDNLIDASYKR